MSNVEKRRRRDAKDVEQSSAKYATGRKGVANARSSYATCAKAGMCVNQGVRRKRKGSTRRNGMRNGGKKMKRNCSERGQRPRPVRKDRRMEELDGQR